MGARQPPFLLTCDCVSWRLDLFEEALARVGEAVRRWDHLAELRLGYRLRDDVAFLVIEPGLFGDARLGVLSAAEARLPGLRTLDLPPGGPSPERVRQKALASCDLVTSALTVAGAVTRLRATLGMTDDRRTTLRLSVDLPLRYGTPGGWVQASTRDLSLSGIFVRTTSHVPDLGEGVEIELFSDSPGPVTAIATVARHTEEGFGARLLLTMPAQETIYSRLRPLRLSARGAPDAPGARAPAHLDVEVVLAGGAAVERTDNLSRGGAFIRSEHALPAGTPVALDLRPGDQALRIEADVTRARDRREVTDPCGFGVEFKTLSTRAQELLDEFITETLIQPFARVLLGLSAEGLRPSLAAALQRHRCEVLLAATSEEAFEEIAANILTLDYVLLDRRLPGPGVEEVLHRVRDAGGEIDLPVTLLVEPGEDAQALLAAGATATVEALPPEELATRFVEEIAQRREALRAARKKKALPRG